MGMTRGQKKGANSRLTHSKEATKGYVPSDKDRKDVFNMAGYGMTQIDIASVLNVTPVTLRRHFEKQLDTAQTIKNRKVAKALYIQAVKYHNVPAMIFYLKSRAGWRSNDPVPVPALPAAPVDYSKLSREELQQLEDILIKAASHSLDEPRPMKSVGSGKVVNGKVKSNGQ